MNRVVSRGEAAKTLGVSITTLRRWEAAGTGLRGQDQEIITVFSARLYGSRLHQNQKLIDDVKKAVAESARP